MDEPLSNLDAKLRLEMRAEIRRIHTMLGSSTIYVTHDQEEALSLADRIVVMIEGQTRQIGTPEELYSRPAIPMSRSSWATAIW
jgi:putative spermidine/putrescine transport system ATP-binding protein